MNLLGIVFFRVPVAYYLTRRELYLPLLGWTIHGGNLGVVGAWYAMVLDIVVRCILRLRVATVGSPPERSFDAQEFHRAGVVLLASELYRRRESVLIRLG